MTLGIATAELGTWFKGTRYPRRSDSSPDGRLFGYFALRGAPAPWDTYCACKACKTSAVAETQPNLNAKFLSVAACKSGMYDDTASDTIVVL